MSKWDWNELFGEGFLVDFAPGQRRYFALDECDNLDTTIYLSKTNLWYKRTTAFWRGSTIVKVIVEENRVLSNSVINLRNYTEYDTHLETENREFLLPLTSKGKKKKVNATNILSFNPFGCVFSLSIREKTHISVSNPRNCQRLAIGEKAAVSRIKGKEDFTNFVNNYIASCPADYDDRLSKLKTYPRVTGKYYVGDIFRVELDRFRYCYGIITGEVNKMNKWPELPKRHSLRSRMMVPIMVRFFDLITENAHMTADDLSNYPLRGVQICGDNDIIWGTHPIVGTRRLVADDVDFDLICTKFISKNDKLTVFSQDFLMGQNLMKHPESYSLYVEWGTAATELPPERISGKLAQLIADYRSPFGGVSISVWPHILEATDEERATIPAVKYDLRSERNRQLRQELFACLGLPPDADFDDFARKFGGMTKTEILKRI